MSGLGECKPRDILGLISAAACNTDNENIINPNYIFQRLKEKKARTIQPSKKRKIEDIRAQWVTFEKLNQWFTDQRAFLLETKFAEDIEVVNEDGSLEEILSLKRLDGGL